MITVKRLAIEHCIAGVLAAAAGTGCTSSVPGTHAVSPAVAEVDVNAHTAACTIEGSPRIVASKAWPGGGVGATAESSTVWLRFARKGEPSFGLAVDPESLEAVDQAGAMPAALPALGDFVHTAWSDKDLLPEPADSGSTRRSSPIVVPVDAHRSVWVWTEGSTYTGMDVHVLTVGRLGEPLGGPLTLPHEGSAIGRPTAAVSATGRGVVAFLESNGRGFQVVAASLDCAATEAAQSWASRGP